MTPFAFHRPASVASAVQLRSAQADASYLAGGQSLLPAMKLGLAGPSDLIDLSLLSGAQGIAVDGGSLRIGAMTPHAVVAASSRGAASTSRRWPAWPSGIGDPAVRSRGTLGGSLANNDPAACWPAAVLGLGATVHTDRRQIAADDFFSRPVRDRAAAGRADHGGELPGARSARPMSSSSSRRRALRWWACSSARGRRACAWPSPAPGPACSAPARSKRRWPRVRRRRRSTASSCRRTS